MREQRAPRGQTIRCRGEKRIAWRGECPVGVTKHLPRLFAAARPGDPQSRPDGQCHSPADTCAGRRQRRAGVPAIWAWRARRAVHVCCSGRLPAMAWPCAAVCAGAGPGAGAARRKSMHRGTVPCGFESENGCRAGVQTSRRGPFLNATHWPLPLRYFPSVAFS